MAVSTTDRVAFSAGLVVMGFILHWFWGQIAPPTPEALMEGVKLPKALLQQAEELSMKNPEVVEVVSGVYVSIGFTFGNSIMLDAPEGVIIVDTTESVEGGRDVLAAFRAITQKPIKAIIYTHNHADHVNGALAFIEDPENPPDVWSHYTLPDQLKNTATVNMIHYKRAMRQFGVFLPDSITLGFGSKLRYDIDKSIGVVAPNKFLRKDQEDVTIAGLKLRLIHIPGETPDQIGVWIPEKKTLLCADDYYKAFPNLYAIRGTPSRNVMIWAQSLDRMRKLRPEYLVPQHTRPLVGEELIYDTLTGYRDAIQFIHDQTVRYMNKGMLPDEITKHVKLPESLTKLDHLKEHYGTVEWSVKGVFTNYMGWFSGDPVELTPLSHTERSKRMISLIGGPKAVINAAKTALNEKDWRWALELASFVFNLDSENADARNIRFKALKELAGSHVNPLGRNYYLTMALEDHELIDNQVAPRTKNDQIKTMPMIRLLEAMTYRLKAEEVDGVEKATLFNFTDIGETFLLKIKHSICEILPGEKEGWDFMVSTSSANWRSILSKETSPVGAYMSGDVVIEGGLTGFREFTGYFEQVD